VCPGPPHHIPTPSPRSRRYPSDSTDAEWALLKPLLPPPACTQPTGGRPETHPRRQLVDAIRYLVHNGCVWRALPTDFPPWPTVYGHFARWAADGTLGRVHDTLRQQVRQAHGRQPTPSAAIIDSQSVRAAETVPKPSRGYDAANKINGRKRHIAVDTLGLLLVVLVTAASVQDRDAARTLLWRLRVGLRRIRLRWGDAAYQGRLVGWAAATLGLRCRSCAGAWPMPSRSWPADGWWSAPWPGSAATAAPYATTSGTRPSRRDGHLGDGHRHDPPAGPPAPSRPHPRPTRCGRFPGRPRSSTASRESSGAHPCPGHRRGRTSDPAGSTVWPQPR
jgi:transposase